MSGCVKGKTRESPSGTITLTMRSLRRKVSSSCTDVHENYGLNMKEGHVLFNDVLNTFYLRLYGVGHYGKGPLR